MSPLIIWKKKRSKLWTFVRFPLWRKERTLWTLHIWAAEEDRKGGKEFFVFFFLCNGPKAKKPVWHLPVHGHVENPECVRKVKESAPKIETVHDKRSHVWRRRTKTCCFPRCRWQPPETACPQRNAWSAARELVRHVCIQSRINIKIKLMESTEVKDTKPPPPSC